MYTGIFFSKSMCRQMPTRNYCKNDVGKCVACRYNAANLLCLGENRQSIVPTVLQRSYSNVPAVNEKVIEDHLAVQAIIRSYQVRGHLVAQLDPLGIMYNDRTTTISDRRGSPPDQITRQHKLNAADMDRVFKLPSTCFIGGKEKALPLKEILKRLELTYCRHIGCEFMHIHSIEECNFFRQRMETPGAMEISNDQKKLCLARLCRAHGFEAFLTKKWKSEKRFGLEGCDILIPAMKQLIDRSSEYGVESVVIGMPHRGRMNVLANICRKPLSKIFAHFTGLEPADTGSGDVKYHLGTTVERLNRVTNKNIKIAVVANPSHLETVAPITQGKVRAEQFYKGDKDGKKVLSVIMHGDASFCGQGVVFETIHMSYLPAYTTHGSVHIVVNNQVGFTTDPRSARSSMYCSDVGKVVNAPILHVNCDDPESVIHVINMAAEYRAKFRKDVVIDMVCYRRNGHQELDQPSFTQPLMYLKIAEIKPLYFKYSEQLVKEGITTEQEVKDVTDKYDKICAAEYEASTKEKTLKFSDWIDSPWSGFFQGRDMMKCNPTGIPEEVIQHIATKFSSPPPESLKFVIHKGIERILKNRMALVKARKFDFPMGEALAYGALLKEGIHVRVSGEDVERGTFSHRHHVLHHQTTDMATYTALANLYPDQAVYSITNSSLSEYGIMGFDCGFAMTNPNALVVWEAQFGDFANTAQCIIDTIIVSGQAKWARQLGIVLSLPHGMEGQGPEHSSARLERFLQMCQDDCEKMPNLDKDFVIKQLFDTNLIVTNVTTPANLFHLFRRQIALPFRKPLIQMSPKSLLKNAIARSSFDEIKVGTEFRRMIPEEEAASKNPAGVKRLFFSAGKVYYECHKYRKEANQEAETAMARVEQLCPFPYDLVKAECEKYSNAKIFWLQEETKNYGGYAYFAPRLRTCLGGAKECKYVGRPPSAAPAPGNKHIYVNEVKALKDAFNKAA